jgi:hypothetical protein
MPFTPAHTAIVLPLLRSKRFSATGLIIGSMAPDFEYFFKMGVNSKYSHTLAGLFYFDVPVAILLAFLFHQVAKVNLIDNLPGFLQQRVQPLRNFAFSVYFKANVLVFILSALVGASSHIGWDAFTHNDGYFVSELPFIYEGVFIPLDGARYPLWYALQHISTGVGLSILLIYILYLPAATLPVAKPKLMYWLGVVGITALVVGLRFRFDFDKTNIGNVVVTLISGFILSLLTLGLTSKRNREESNHG